MIIIEGPDNSGKSGIANYLKDYFGVETYHAGGPPKSKEDIVARATFLLDNYGRYIFDRAALISEPVYSILRTQTGNSLLAGEEELYERFRSLRPIIIYCRPPRTNLLRTERHVIKAHDTPEHVKAVHDNAEKLIDRYEQVMEDPIMPPHIVYDYTTDSKPDIAKLVEKYIQQRKDNWPIQPQLKERAMPKNPIEDVREFQEQILSKPFPLTPIGFDEKLMNETIVRLDEELEELEEATLLSDQADALVDLIYFALGALHQAGVDAQRVWDEVHLKNMTKKKGITKRGDDNDAAKPADWTPPDHTWLDNVIN